MIELIIKTPNPFTVTGETTQELKPGETGTWSFTITGDPAAPEMQAEIATFIPGPTDPTTDFAGGTPKWTLNGREVNLRTYNFPFPSGGVFTLDVEITLSKTAAWYSEMRVQINPRPYFPPS